MTRPASGNLLAGSAPIPQLDNARNDGRRRWPSSASSTRVETTYRKLTASRDLTGSPATKPEYRRSGLRRDCPVFRRNGTKKKTGSASRSGPICARIPDYPTIPSGSRAHSSLAHPVPGRRLRRISAGVRLYGFEQAAALPDQLPKTPPLGHGHRAVHPMLPGITVASRCAAAGGAAMHPTALLPGDRRQPARAPAAGPRTAWARRVCVR